VLSVTFC